MENRHSETESKKHPEYCKSSTCKSLILSDLYNITFPKFNPYAPDVNQSYMECLQFLHATLQQIKPCYETIHFLEHRLQVLTHHVSMAGYEAPRLKLILDYLGDHGEERRLIVIQDQSMLPLRRAIF